MNQNQNTNRPFVTGKMAIDSLRDNGILSSAHALAELIDNSVQAGADRIELIVFEKKQKLKNGKRTITIIEKIGVLDNGCGMSQELLYSALELGGSENRKDLKGIGKFGMGLPTSSISQCKRVEVWSWKEGNQSSYTFLDIEDIKVGKDNIPYPTHKEIPSDIRRLLGERLPKSGTFVLWSKIDRCDWKTGNTIYRHTQDIIGRMYRYFLKDDKISIWFKRAELNKEKKFYVLDDKERFKANDPLYLMKNTALPELPGEYSGEAMFEIVYDEPLLISDEHGKEHEIRIKASFLKASVAEAIKKTTDQNIGHTSWGKDAAKNNGISVLRAGRELRLMPGFYPKELDYISRWCGIEISFGPELDTIFKVDNNKQHVSNFRPLKLAEESEKEGLSEIEYKSDLKANGDPKLQIYRIIEQIDAIIRDYFRPKLNKLNTKGTLSKQKSSLADKVKSKISSIIEKINIKNEQRETVHPGNNDNEPTQESVAKTLKDHGSSAEEAKFTAKQIMENDLKVWVEYRQLGTRAFFDITTENGFTLMQLNDNHPFTKILNTLPEEQKNALELCLAGWARMEWECRSEKLRQQLQRARNDWGVLLEDYLEEDES